jgi:hypothetical protein
MQGPPGLLRNLNTEAEPLLQSYHHKKQFAFIVTQNPMVIFEIPWAGIPRKSAVTGLCR